MVSLNKIQYAMYRTKILDQWVYDSMVVKSSDACISSALRSHDSFRHTSMVARVTIENRGYSSTFSFRNHGLTITRPVLTVGVKPETQNSISGFRTGISSLRLIFFPKVKLKFPKRPVRCPSGPKLEPTFRIGKLKLETWSILRPVTSQDKMVVQRNIRWPDMRKVEDSLVQARHLVHDMSDLIQRNREVGSTQRSAFHDFSPSHML